jgi:hypothetical protein
MTSTPRAASTHPSLALSPAERAAVAAELARLRARVANLTARLDRLHTALATPGRPSAQPTDRLALPGLHTALGARSWR